MILDQMDRLDDYRSLRLNFGPIFDKVKATDLVGHEEGRFDWPDGAVLIVESQQAGPGGLGTLEVHQKYIDLQIGIEGVFTVGWRAKHLCDRPQGEYDEENDFLLYDDIADFYFPVKAASFALLFPDDAHAPAPCEVLCKKAVVKIPV